MKIVYNELLNEHEDIYENVSFAQYFDQAVKQLSMKHIGVWEFQ